MNVPPLAEFLRWMNEMPAPFRRDPEGFAGGVTRVRAVVADLFETLAGGVPEDAFLSAFAASRKDAAERNRLLWALAACRLFWHPAFRDATAGWRAQSVAALRKFFLQELPGLAAVAPVEGLLKDEERQEELVRRALRSFGLRLPGEGEAEARDRMAQVDSVARRQLMAEVAKRQQKLRYEQEKRRREAEALAASKMPRE